MQYEIVGIGVVKMTVGVRRRSHEKVQNCITAFEVYKERLPIGSLNFLPQDYAADVYHKVRLEAGTLC